MIHQLSADFCRELYLLGTMPDKKLSRTLSYILRHDPGTYGLTADEEGWVKVDELIRQLRARQVPVTRETLEELVRTNDKQRFSFNSDGSSIRASQGHSIPVQLGYTPARPPAVLYHGTAEKNLSSILSQGLQKKERHHVHLSSDKATARVVGQRYGKPVVLTIQAAVMHAKGCLFYQSDNGVWLTDSVAPEFIAAGPDV